MSIGLAWRQVRDRFRAAGIDTAELDARLIAQEAFGLDALRLVSREREAAAEVGLARLEAFALRRLAGTPVARLIGEREFWGLRFSLSPATLVPRPETEMLVAEGIERLQFLEAPRILDLGTGSGAIAVALIHSLANATAIATDISAAALATARANAERHRVAGRVKFLEGDWYEPLDAEEKFDLIVSNPPYIASAVIETLAPEVKDHDPPAALDGGMDGLVAYRAIAAQAPRRLKPGGALIVEIGSSQGPLVSRLMGRAGFAKVELLRDLAGLDRVVTAAES